MSKKLLTEEETLLLPQNMLKLYSIGAFPMADSDTQEVTWHFPEIRTIIPIDSYNVPRSLKKIIQKNDFEIRYDSDYLKVINNCADRDETWISEKIIEGYKRLEKLGFLHTVEVYKKNKLVGGLYGITFKGAFFGESMFSKIEQSSKIALVKLLERLKEKNFALLDVQFMTEHLKMFGAIEISYEDYKNLLIEAYSRECIF